MPGPLVHKAAMENLCCLLNSDGIDVHAGTAYSNIKADIKYNSHGYSVENNTGTIFDKIIELVNQIQTSNNTDIIWLTERFRLICHFCTDSMSIGQISRETWGKYDNRFDALGEFVLDKRKYGCLKSCAPLIQELIKYDQLETMQNVYDLNISICKKWNYCLTDNFRTMIRRAVYMGSCYAYLWCKLALQKETH